VSCLGGINLTPDDRFRLLLLFPAVGDTPIVQTTEVLAAGKAPTMRPATIKPRRVPGTIKKNAEPRFETAAETQEIG
jgi:hypothetical protein